MKKILFNGQMGNEIFLIVIYHSMNAARVCKLRNGVKKKTFFQWPKVNQVRNEYSPRLSKLMA
jgi:hypothetical protein